MPSFNVRLNYCWRDASVVLMGTDKDRRCSFLIIQYFVVLLEKTFYATFNVRLNYCWRDASVVLMGTDKDRRCSFLIIQYFVVLLEKTFYATFPTRKSLSATLNYSL